MISWPRPATRDGLDLYSLFTSIEAVVAYLDRVDPEAARRARARYACFEHFEQDTRACGYAAAAGLAESSEDDVVEPGAIFFAPCRFSLPRASIWCLAVR